MNAGASEISERYGDMDVAPHLRWVTWMLSGFVFAWGIYIFLSGPLVEEDPHFEKWCKLFDHNLAGAMYAAERNSRGKGSLPGFDWDRVMGRTEPKKGYHSYDINYQNPLNYVAASGPGDEFKN
ncbi:unnamed protein product [Phytomonas sp. Hart1]|nr:unnamed protein product [Phytomonas sp. Hart1]|eukprot:CCW67732.1 unnamed protein product [Phytomonas sp. isolate Hart1]